MCLGYAQSWGLGLGVVNFPDIPDIQTLKLMLDRCLYLRVWQISLKTGEKEILNSELSQLYNVKCYSEYHNYLFIRSV